MEMKRETKEDSIHTIVFTAGTFLLMVCLKHFLVEQWHAWVFLILNVILLAILFMSMRPTNLEQSSESQSSVGEVKCDDKEKKRPSGVSQEIEQGKECYIKQCCSSNSTTTTNTCVHVENEVEDEDEEEEEEEEEEQVPLLSKEELNERVEAFIAMFRQHLISDVKQAENFRLHKIEVSCC